MNLEGSAGISTFSPFWHPNLGHEPVHIDSVKTLDAECEKRGVFIKEAKKNERPKRLPQSEKEALHA